MTLQPHLGNTFLGVNGLQRVLRLIENQDVSICAHGCNQVRLLRHVARFVNLSLVHNPLGNGKSALVSSSVTANLLLCLIVLARVLLSRCVWKLDFGDLEVVDIVA